MISAQAVAVPDRHRCAVRRRLGGLSDDFAPASYVGSADPEMVWEVLIGGIVVCSFLAADRAVDLLGAAQGQALAVCAETHLSVPP